MYSSTKIEIILYCKLLTKEQRVLENTHYFKALSSLLHLFTRSSAPWPPATATPFNPAATGTAAAAATTCEQNAFSKTTRTTRDPNRSATRYFSTNTNSNSLAGDGELAASSRPPSSEENSPASRAVLQDVIEILGVRFERWRTDAAGGGRNSNNDHEKASHTNCSGGGYGRGGVEGGVCGRVIATGIDLV